MSLPEITAPAGLPAFSVSGHEVAAGDVFAHVASGQGHTRMRRVFSSQERHVTVGWRVLTGAQMTAVDAWFEDVLHAGEIAFAAYLPNQGPGKGWFAARWFGPYTATPKKTSHGIVWDVSGTLVIASTGYPHGPATTTLAVEFSALLTGAAVVPIGTTSIAVEFVAHLNLSTTLRVEFAAHLLVIANPAYLQLEDGSYLLLESGSRILLEA